MYLLYFLCLPSGKILTLRRLLINIESEKQKEQFCGLDPEVFEAAALRCVVELFKDLAELSVRAYEKLFVLRAEFLAQLVQSGKPYLLMLAANRIYKNPSTVVKVFSKLQEEYPDLHLLTLKYGKSTSHRHIDIDYLSDADLEHAYKHAYALVFGSFFEGFGYPPIEAARHGTPTVASNVTSIPEILGDAGIYFSPFYPADLYRALKLVLADRDTYAMKSSQRYEQICKRQRSDLNSLINEIGNKTTSPAL